VLDHNRRPPSGQLHEVRLITARRAALPASAGDRKHSIRVSAVMVAPVWGVAESAPCPLIAAGFCERAGGSQGRAAPAQRRRQAPLTRPPGSGSCQAARGQGAHGGAGCGSAVQAGGLSMRGDLPWRPGTGHDQPALPRSAGRGRCPGDMMIDWVSPPAGMRPLSLIRPSAWPCGAGPAAADSGSAGAGRGGPHRVSWAAVCLSCPAFSGQGICG
jgi:hypothetical protein